MSTRDLNAAVKARGFTPGRQDIAPLWELLLQASDAEGAKAVEQALLRAPGILVYAHGLPHLSSAVRPHRARILALLVQAPGVDATVLKSLLLGYCGDADLKTASVAVASLDRFEGDAEIERALLDLLATARPEQRRGLVRTLGKIGTAATQAVLASLDAAGDGELGRLLAQAQIIIARRAGRTERSEIRGDWVPDNPLTLHFHCRRGLEVFVIDELAGLGVQATKVADGRVAARWQRPLSDAFSARCFDELALVFPRGDPFTLLTAAATRRLLGALTVGPLRYRLDFGTDAERWALAARVTAACPELVNDPTQSTWELRQDAATRVWELLPKRLNDPRFTYRRKLLPASSHAPLAAVLARLGGERPDDIVWDPFCGAGNELIERALRGPHQMLIGTDLSADALAAATENLQAAGIVGATLLQGDCLKVILPAKPTLIVSNPPLGRRVRAGEAAGLVTSLIQRAQNLLALGGRMVLVSPAPAESRAAALSANLTITKDLSVDMGGFVARIQVFFNG